MSQTVLLLTDVFGDDMLVNFDDVRLVRKPLSTENRKANSILVFKNGDTYGAHEAVDEIGKLWNWTRNQ